MLDQVSQAAQSSRTWFPVCVCVCVCVWWGGVFIHEEGSESQQEQLGVVTALNSLFGSGPCYCGISVHLIMPSLGGR